MEAHKSISEREFVIVNVGANTSHAGLISPLWGDGTFCFMPIPEDGPSTDPSRDLFPGCPNLPTFSEFIKPHIAFCVQKKYLTKKVHDDPEFETFTYGDNPEGVARAKAANLKNHLSQGDLLFFFAGLTSTNKAKTIGNYRFYFIGFFEISAILRKVSKMPSKDELMLFNQNAHIKRGLADPSFFNDFWLWKGSSNSQLFLEVRWI